jgi:hypothetical protein
MQERKCGVLGDGAYTFRVYPIESGEDGREVEMGFIALLKKTVIDEDRYAFEVGNRRLL